MIFHLHQYWFWISKSEVCSYISDLLQLFETLKRLVSNLVNFSLDRFCIWFKLSRLQIESHCVFIRPLREASLSYNLLLRGTPCIRMTDQSQVLVLGAKPNEESSRRCPALFFSQLAILLHHIAENLSKIDQFILFIPVGNLLELLNDPNYGCPQVRLIHVLYRDTAQMQRDKERYEHDHPKLKFSHERTVSGELERLTTNVALDRSRSVDTSLLQSVVFGTSQRMAGKRSATTTENSAVSKRICARPSTASPHPQGEPIAEKYICRWCQLILQIPHQLECGHRVCKSCLPNLAEWVLSMPPIPETCLVH